MTCKWNSWVAQPYFRVRSNHARLKTLNYGLSFYKNYNTIDGNLQTELLPTCRRHYALHVMIFNPAAEGMLPGKYKTNDVPSEGRYSDTVGWMGRAY